MVDSKEITSSNTIRLIEAVKTPLAFFTLVIIIIQILFLKIFDTGTSSTLNLIIIISPIILLILIVSLFAFFRPHALYGKAKPSKLIDAHIVQPPTEKKSYTKLFDDFEDCDFFAFNPPFEVEHSGKIISSSSLKIHKKRYKNNVNSRYLFFNKRSFENGQKYFEALADKIGIQDVEEHIDIRLWSDCPDPPGYTFFVGKKHDKSAIILYPKAVIQKGIPNAVIYMEGADSLSSILRKYFLDQWRDSKLSPKKDDRVVLNE